MVLQALAGGVIVLAGLAAYSNSFHGALFIDDFDAILNNPTIRHLWRWTVFSPPCNGNTVGGRPILNLSLAINYALDGTEVWGYHAVNLVIHLLNGLLLLTILRRTFLLPPLRPNFGRNSLLLAWAIALLWVMHPLQTQPVTYIAHRAESLASLFYLLVLYAVIRGSQSGRPIRWYWLAVIACWLGVATKEIVVTAPIVVLFYDRMFLAGSFHQAWRQRWKLYLGLTSAWLVMAALMITIGGRADTAGFGYGMTSWEYVATQGGAILHYVRLALWPRELRLDYGNPVAQTMAEILPGTLFILVLAGLTGWAWLRRNGLGFLGFFFLVVLSPSSSFVPIVVQTMAERRMYLPLAAVIALLVISVHLVGQRWIVRSRLAMGLCLVISIAAILGVLTFQRNQDYHSDLSMKKAEAIADPYNPAAQNSWGCALWNAGQPLEAVEHYKEALRLKPDYADAHNNLGLALLEASQPTEAIQHFEQAILTLESSSGAAIVHCNWGNALAKLGRLEESIEHYRHAVRIKTDFPEVHNKWGGILLMLKRPQEAIEHYQQAVRIDPNHADAQYNWGNTLLALGHPLEAIERFKQVLQLKPDHAMAHYNWGVALLTLGRPQEATEHFQQTMRIDPNYAQAQFEKAITAAKMALQQAEAAGQSSLAEKIRMQLQLYRDQKSYRGKNFIDE